VIREIVNVCESLKGEVYLISNFCHEYSPGEGIHVITVDKSPEAADLAIVNRSRPGDIVVTQDLGVACMLLGKRVRIISPHGRIYAEHDMNQLMEFRHLLKRERRKSRMGSKSKPFTEVDRSRFLRNIMKLISEVTEELDHDKGD
jgi:hypothetical protein